MKNVVLAVVLFVMIMCGCEEPVVYGEFIGSEIVMIKRDIFDRIIDIISAIGPIIAVIITGIFVPVIYEWWKDKKIKYCYHSLMLYFDKICHSHGTKWLLPTIREIYISKDSDIKQLIKDDQDASKFGMDKGWVELENYSIKTSLNIARKNSGLEEGKFYYSSRFVNRKCGEMLAVLTVIKNTAEITVFLRGDWDISSKKHPFQFLGKWKKIKKRLFGYKRSKYSVMLV